MTEEDYTRNACSEIELPRYVTTPKDIFFQLESMRLMIIYHYPDVDVELGPQIISKETEFLLEEFKGSLINDIRTNNGRYK